MLEEGKGNWKRREIVIFQKENCYNIYNKILFAYYLMPIFACCLYILTHCIFGAVVIWNCFHGMRKQNCNL